MQVTDEMVDAAWLRYQKSLKTDSSTGELSMRAALEAALNARIPAFPWDTEELSAKLNADDCWALADMAACVEDLTAALTHIAVMDGYTLGCEDQPDKTMRAFARATLKKWGLK